jgi:hypothetical protein
MMELLMWLEQVYVWQLQRKESELLKVEPDHLWPEDELLEVSYPKGDEHERRTA